MSNEENVTAMEVDNCDASTNIKPDECESSSSSDATAESTSTIDHDEVTTPNSSSGRHSLEPEMKHQTESNVKDDDVEHMKVDNDSDDIKDDQSQSAAKHPDRVSAVSLFILCVCVIQR
jgi:hypothetical protein